MEKSYFEDEHFGSLNYAEKVIQRGEYDNCTFDNCIFAGVDLSDFVFEECVFKNCDFSNSKITNTAFKTVEFNNCKLIGLQFDECNSFLLAFRFITCQLNLSSFYRLKIKGTFFKDCILHEVDFTETVLTASIFNNCDFSGTIFANTNLEKTDFSSSFNFSIDPELNRILGAKFSTQNLSGLTDKYGIIIVN